MNKAQPRLRPAIIVEQPDGALSLHEESAGVAEKRGRKLPRPPKDGGVAAGSSTSTGSGSGMRTPSKGAGPHNASGGAMAAAPCTPGPKPVHVAATPITPLPSTPAKAKSSVKKGLRTPLKRSRQKKTDGREAFRMASAYSSSGDLDLLDAILQTGTVEITIRNDEGHTLLDLAVMMNQHACARLLQLYGCPETEEYLDPAFRSKRLDELLHAKQEALGTIMDQIKSGNKSLAKERERRRKECDKIEALHRRWTSSFKAAGLPSPPAAIRLTAASPTSLMLTLSPPKDHKGAVVTRFRVEWASNAAFDGANCVVIPGVVEEYVLENLPQGVPCYVRVASCNLRGTGEFGTSVPACMTPSTWREAQGSTETIERTIQQLEGLEAEMNRGPERLPDHELPDKVKKKVFGGSVKFDKKLKRGVYFAMVLYNDGLESQRIAMNSSVLPIVLIDANPSPADLPSHLTWAQKVSTNWASVRVLFNALPTEVAGLTFQSHFLRVISQLQNSLGMVNLGVMHSEAIKEQNGAVIFVSVLALPASRSKLKLGLSWQPSTAIKMPSAVRNAVEQAPENLMSSWESLVKFNQTLFTTMEPGLYLACILPEASAAGIQIKAMGKQPSTPPCVRIRDTAHVSKTEWDHIMALLSAEGEARSHSQLQAAIVAGIAALAKDLGISSEELKGFRMYHSEVVEINSELAFLLLLPPQEQFLSEMHRAITLGPTIELLRLPVSSFETFLWAIYQEPMWHQFVKLSTFIGMRLTSLKLELRRALDDAEIDAAESAIQAMEGFHERLQTCWESRQWVGQVLKWGREKDIKQLSVEMLRKGVHLQPETPRRQRSAKDAARSARNAIVRRQASQTSGMGTLVVYTQGSADKSTHFMQKLTISQLTTAKAVVEQLVSELQITKHPEDYALFLVEGDTQKERQIADDCRPLLMQYHWEEKKAKLVFKQA